MTSRPIRLLSRSLLRLRRQGHAPITAHGSSRCYTDFKIVYMSLPMFTDLTDIETVASVLSSKIKEIPEEEARKVNKKAFSDNNLETYEFLGLIDREISGIKLTEAGREYGNASDEKKKDEILRKNIKKINIYDTTLEYLHHNQKLSPTKTEIGSYWNENFNDKVSDLSEDQISSAVIFFLRLTEKVKLGKFINAGRGRETRIDLDNVKLAEYVTLKLEKPAIQKIKDDEQTSAEKPKKTKAIEVPEEIISDQELSPSSLRALGKLQIGLKWQDLDSDGAKKLIIEKLDDLQQENTVLQAKVERLHQIDKDNAVLVEKNGLLSNINLVRTSVNSIGGIILGASFSVTETAPKIIGLLMGALLIGLSIFYREKSKEKQSDKSK
jgi:hypothetical protein